MSDKIELMMLCGVLQSNFSCLSQSESRTQSCHVRITISQQAMARCPVKYFESPIFFGREIFLLPVFLSVSTTSHMHRKGYVPNTIFLKLSFNNNKIQ